MVLLILAGITITFLLNDGGIFSKAQRSKEQTRIGELLDKFNVSEATVALEKLGKPSLEDFIHQVQNKEGYVTEAEKQEEGYYQVTTEDGYVFEVSIIEGSSTNDIIIEYVGKEGKVLPIIKRIEVSATSTSITGKVTVSRLGNGTLKYYYKLKTATDSEYKEIIKINSEMEAIQETGIIAGEEYVIKVVAKNDAGEVEGKAEVTATKIFAMSITLDKSEETLKLGDIDTVSLIATILPENATNKNIVWESSNTAVATVDNTGIVTGRASGTAIITAATTDGSNKTATCTITVKVPTVADVVGEIQTSNKTINDENGNTVVIPSGFKVVSNGTQDVTYDYEINHKPCVQDGIVIEDEEGNQFVWIPVGDIKNKDGSITKITLGRYRFNTTNGTPTLQQNADNYTQVVTIARYDFNLATGSSTLKQSANNCDRNIQIRTFYSDDTTSNRTKAKDLKSFARDSQTVCGYYIARYEASKGADSRVKSKQAKVWTLVDIGTASSASINMYPENDNFVSDLVNSYAWDTAIVFIQNYSKNNQYAIQTSKNERLANTGVNGDKVCNIYDMASNYMEIDTEVSSNTSSSNPRCCNKGRKL